MLLAMATGFACAYSCCYSSRLHQQYGLQEKPCGDCCVHWCCGPCALCQEYRELKSRGFDMSLGEHGEDGEGRRDCPAADAPGDDSLVRVCVRGHVGLRCADQASACVGSVASSRQGMPTCKVDVKLVFSFCYISSCRESHEL
uniref:Uncharacterized protein n=2 Tax=Oryza glumipatula TaxID=40148 RepID=A0A0D9ZLR0_9ORYZ